MQNVRIEQKVGVRYKIFCDILKPTRVGLFFIMFVRVLMEIGG